MTYAQRRKVLEGLNAEQKQAVNEEIAHLRRDQLAEVEDFLHKLKGATR